MDVEVINDASRMSMIDVWLYIVGVRLVSPNAAAAAAAGSLSASQYVLLGTCWCHLSTVFLLIFSTFLS